ncbi:hypothetical protein SR1949_51830 [Sphaerospermopsis reniformis]|uniref:Uncharacterized protein n=1 Tax=Sphaerospermopsis reniformis TaxID=531300 RepID=A0A480A5E2_9CYAN|nr:hypothetical protein SR1949_51830 [Sphaerospermopsis reniformis]
MAAKTFFSAMMGTFNLFSLPRISPIRLCSDVISMTLMRVGVSLILMIFCDVNLGENSKVRRPCFSFLTSSSGSPLTISTRILGVSSQKTKGCPINAKMVFSLKR